jgi:DNA-binding CsgD family transcriptional regulator
MVGQVLRNPGPVLRGREAERARLDQLLRAVRAGQSAVLVLRGQAGIGKTALLDYAAERSEGCRVVRAVGVESEMELPFAALHQLCTPLLDGRERLPPPQRDALATAFGLSSGPRPDRFLVGLAVLSLLSDGAEAEPLICLVDDAQWLDRSSAQVLSFVARRLEAESVILLFAERDQDELDELAGLPELRLQGLSDADARGLLASANVGPLDERVRDRIIAESRGNPLALLELPRGLSSASLIGGFAMPNGLPLPSRIEASFRRRVGQLPTETQRLLLVAAAEPIGDPTLLWRAAAELGIPIEAAAPAEADDLMEVGARVTFRHPLLRSAIYRAASPDERREAHRALAGATDPEVDPDRRAWHRAHAALAPDDDVAAELELSAGRAQARGGLAAAAAFLERAAALTPEPDRRAQRTLAAARAKRLAGLPHAALTLLATAAPGPLDELDGAIVQRLRGQIALDLSRYGDAVPLLLDAAKRLESLDAALARETHLEALWAATLAGRLGGGVQDAAEAARAAPPASQPPRATDLLLDGLAVRFTDGYSAGAPILKRALETLRDEDGRDEQEMHWPWMAARVAAELFDDEAWNLLATRDAQIARDIGALSVLPITLNYLATMRIFEGNLDAAARLLDEADAITTATGNTRISAGRLLLAACRGDEAQVSMLNEAIERDAAARGDGGVLTFGEYARALLNNGLGHYEHALAAAQHASAQDDLRISTWTLPELVEAAVRSGRPQVAADALKRLSERTRAAGTTLALGIEARSCALISEGAPAEGLYREAIELLGRTRMRLDLARAHLLYGEWLRRENRRVDGREQLRPAHELFAAMGADGFGERAARELLATGEKARRRTADTRAELTAQEAQIAQLARDGYSNPEIGAQLFISPRTVEYHLHKVFTKLAISSRIQLDEALRSGPRKPQPV